MDEQNACSWPALALLAGRFAGRDDAYARQTARGYLAVREPLSRARLAGHLRGRETLAIYPLLPDATTRLLCWDFDRAGDVAGLHASVSALRALLAARGVGTALEDSGRKGYHVWAFAAEPLPAVLAIQAARAALRLAGLDRAAAEVFPRQARARDLGNCIKLPWGVHRVSGRRCLFLDPAFQPAADQVGTLAQVPDTPREALAQLVSAYGVRGTEYGARARDLPEPEGLVSTESELTPYAALRTPCIALPTPCVVAMLAGVPEGAREVAAFSLAKHFRRAGLPPAVALAALRAWNRRNRPPLPRSVLADKVVRVYRWGYRSLGCEDPIVGRFCSAACPLYAQTHGE